jgi:hypothetical protein
MKYFCSTCGKTTQYNFELPKFCAFCGQSFANKSASLNAQNQGAKFLNELKLKKNINSNSDEDTENLEKSINYKKIKPSFKIDVYNPKGESLGSLIDNPSAPVEINNGNNVIPKKTKEEILSEFQKEAGSLRSQ